MTTSRTAALRLLARQLRPVRTVAGGAFGVLLLSVLATMAGPFLVQKFVDSATSGATSSSLVRVALAYLAVAVLGGAARVGASYLAVQCGWRVADNLRTQLLRHALTGSSVLEVERRPPGEVLEKVDGNADIVGRSIAEFGFRMVGNVAVSLGTLVVMLFVVPAAGVALSLLVVAACLLLNRVARRSARLWEKAREQQAELFGFTGDSLAARDDLLPAGRSQWAMSEADAQLSALYRTESRAYLGGRAFWPLTQLVFALAFGAGFGFGLVQLQQDALSIGTLTLIYLFVDLLQRPLEEMSSQAGQLQKMMAVLAVAARTLEAAPAPVRDEHARATLPAGPPEVVFDDVIFGYGETPVLRGVSFSVAPGGSLGIVGPTGAGKSTVINLLCGLARPDRGRVLVGGVDAAGVHPDELARRLTVLSQRAHVFTATVGENVTLFDDTVPAERIWDVLERLGAAGWVRELPEGLDTEVGAGARSLSEGEMQVLVGARALMRPDSLLVVDEGTSRMDPEAERNWTALLDTLLPGRTVVLVAHRHDTLRGVADVLHLVDGQVAELVSGGMA